MTFLEIVKSVNFFILGLDIYIIIMIKYSCPEVVATADGKGEILKMRLCEKKYYNYYEVERNEDGAIIDLYYLRTYDNLNNINIEKRRRVNKSNTLLEDMLTIVVNDIEGNQREFALFEDIELFKKDNKATLIDRRINKAFTNLSRGEVFDYILENNYEESDALYSYNNGAIIVIR